MRVGNLVMYGRLSSHPFQTLDLACGNVSLPYHHGFMLTIGFS